MIYTRNQLSLTRPSQENTSTRPSMPKSSTQLLQSMLGNLFLQDFYKPKELAISSFHNRARKNHEIIVQPKLQASADQSTKDISELDSPIHSFPEHLPGGGKSLPPTFCRAMETRFGHNFEGVRVHTGGSAASLAQGINAQAFTSSNHIYFGANEYSTVTNAGQKLLAHELTHVVQQSNSRKNSLKTPTIQRHPGNGLSNQEVRRIRAIVDRVSRQLGRFETSGIITSEELSLYGDQIQWIRDEVREIRSQGRVTGVAARNLRRRAQRVLSAARRLSRLPGWLRQQAQRHRNTRSRRMLSNFSVSPRVIRVHEGESARISFVVRGDRIRSISGHVLSRERTEGTSYRFFNWSRPESGYKVAIWDGTFSGSRNRPPQTGTYRVRISVRDAIGTESVSDQIRVLNPRDETVLPRTQSGLGLRNLVFNGRQAILTDERNNTIEVNASSGMKANHPRNRQRINYTQARYQWTAGIGPIPEGNYSIHKNSVQRPELQAGSSRFSSRATVQNSGHFRVPLHPSRLRNRSDFYFLLDRRGHGTVASIGVHRNNEGGFNQIMALLTHMRRDSLPVQISY